VIPKHGQARQKAVELKEFLDSKVCGTFPRGAANRFAERFGPEGAAFIADMEQFHRRIADYCNLAGKWLQAGAAQIAECRKEVGRPFLELHPQHRHLEPHLAAFPYLGEVLALYEAARKRLTALMTTLEQVKNR
jgi:hypothetical protein